MCLALGPSPHNAFIAEQALQGVSLFISTCEGEYFITTKNICNIHFPTHAGEYGRGGAIREGWLFASVLSTLQVLLSFKTLFQVQNLACFSLLLALDNPKVNYFSLDIEGAEIQVLRSVPWHLVDIEVRIVLSFL